LVPLMVCATLFSYRNNPYTSAGKQPAEDTATAKLKNSSKSWKESFKSGLPSPSGEKPALAKGLEECKERTAKSKSSTPAKAATGVYSNADRASPSSSSRHRK